MQPNVCMFCTCICEYVVVYAIVHVCDHSLCLCVSVSEGESDKNMKDSLI